MGTLQFMHSSVDGCWVIFFMSYCEYCCWGHSCAGVCMTMLSFHLGRCLGVQLVDYKSSVLCILRNCQVFLQDGYSNYYIHPRTVQGLSTLINILYCLSTIYKGILVGMASNLTVLLMDISLITNSVKHLLMCLLGICVSLRNVYAHTSFVSF